MNDTFCACGHEERQHPDHGPCRATEPEPTCSCQGYRLGGRARTDTEESE